MDKDRVDDKKTLRKAIADVIPLSDEEWNEIQGNFVPKKIRKGEYLFQKGHVFDNIAFVESGMMVYFKIVDGYMEYTTDIAFPGDWVSDCYSRIRQVPSFMNVKAIEDSELLVLSNEQLEYLYQRLPKFERFGRLITEQALINFIEVSLDLQTQTAKERYLRLIKQHPDYIMKIPQYHLANFLGITPKSLSRIRKEIAEGK